MGIIYGKVSKKKKKQRRPLSALGEWAIFLISSGQNIPIWAGLISNLFHIALKMSNHFLIWVERFLIRISAC